MINDQINDLRAAYCRASRCWQSNNLKACVRICNSLSKGLQELEDESRESMQLKHLVWFLKIRCLAEDYHINESFLLNEEDILESDDQVRTFSTAAATAASSTTTRQIRPTTAQPGTSSRRTNFGSSTSRRKMTNGSRMDHGTRGGGGGGGQMRTAMLTGKLPTRKGSSRSRQGTSTTSSYRPLTTSLTATQTAFSRSTRPLLKYSTCRFLSKPIYEYLYNAQSITNVCPDYRQCLEYLNLVRSSRRRQFELSTRTKQQQQQQPKYDRKVESNNQLVMLSQDVNETNEQKLLGAHWSLAFGVCYFHLKMYKQAEEFFQVCPSLELKYLDPYLWLIKVYLRFNQPLKVLKTCDLGNENSRNAILYNWKARVQSLVSEQLGAHLSLKESLQFCPTNIEALANVGHYSFYGDKLELALKCFERINQLTLNGGNTAGAGAAGGVGANLVDSPMVEDFTAELFNNLALCNLQCGNYARVMPLFQRAFLNSPNKEITSNIWYNISFVPLAFGARSLAIACLKLALKNDSQNEDAINNLGVLRYAHLINDPLHYANRQEYWSMNLSSARATSNESELINSTNQRQIQSQFDEVETYFGAPKVVQRRRFQSEELDDDNDDNDDGVSSALAHPEMLFNMALVKKKRGQLLASVRYCNLYLQYDQNNHTIRSILREIRQIVSHDS